MDIGWKAIDLAAVAVAGLISDNIVKAGWKLATGHTPPADDDLEANLLEAVVFAMLSGALLAVTRRATVRSVAKWFNKPRPRIEV